MAGGRVFTIKRSAVLAPGKLTKRLRRLRQLRPSSNTIALSTALALRLLPSWRRLFHIDTIYTTNTNEKGRPATTLTDCSEEKPPANKSPSVISPVAAAQKRRSQIGASAPEARFLLLKLASTKAPESAEVTKKINPINTANSDQVAAKG